MSITIKARCPLCPADVDLAPSAIRIVVASPLLNLPNDAARYRYTCPAGHLIETMASDRVRRVLEASGTETVLEDLTEREVDAFVLALEIDTATINAKLRGGNR